MKVVAFYSVYNEADKLLQSIESIAPAVDSFVFLDGRYKGFPGKTVGSNDGTLDLIKSLPYNWTCRSCSDLPQTKKRSKMFDIVREGDWILVIDGDEIAEGAEFLRSELEAVKGDFARVWITGENRWMRLIKARKGAYYSANHHTIHYPGHGSINCLRDGECLSDNFKIHDYGYERAIARREQKELYYLYKMNEEVPYEIR